MQLNLDTGKGPFTKQIAVTVTSAILAKLNAGLKREKGTYEGRENGDNNVTTLSKHAVELGHSIDWKNYEILQIETDYHKRKLIESFYITSLSNVLNDKKSVCFPSIYQNLFSQYHISIF